MSDVLCDTCAMRPVSECGPVKIGDGLDPEDVCSGYRPVSDAVNHPSHYTYGSVEVIDIIRDACGDHFDGFLLGNVIKYVLRFMHKNGVEDLRKAIWYLDRLIGEVGDGKDPAVPA